MFNAFSISYSVLLLSWGKIQENLFIKEGYEGSQEYSIFLEKQSKLNLVLFEPKMDH